MTTSFLEEKREVTYYWHIVQVRKWLKYDNGRKLDNALVYASLELRCAIERYLFELLVLLKKGNFTAEEVRRCKSKDGILDVIRDTEPYYVKRATFTNLIASVDPKLPKVVIIDIKYLIRMWHTLSLYCHKQLKPKESFDSPNHQFQKKGFELINDVVITFMEWERIGAFGIIDKESLPPETRGVYEKYINDQIDEGQAKRMLNLMTPVLIARLKLKHIQRTA
jgi:hypothetical protein